MIKKKWIALAVLAIAFAGTLFGIYQYNATYITVHDTRYLRSSETLDLRDVPLTNGEFDQLQAKMPQCRILWKPNFQGNAYPLDTAVLNVTRLTEEDLTALTYFPQLKTLNAMGCTDYDNILALRKQMPELEVLYSVSAAGREYQHNSSFARLEDGTIADGEFLLQYLPELNSLLFTGTVPEKAELDALAQAHPEVAVDWEVNFRGQTFQAKTNRVDLSGIPLTSKASVEEILPLLPRVKYINLCDTGLPQADALALYEAYPDIIFTWDLAIGNITVPTDAEEIDISGIPMTVQDAEALLPYFPNLKKIIMCDCGISNEAMDALNRRHEDVKFVWSVDLGPIVTVRTDIESFIPFKYCVDFYQEDLYNLRYCTDMVALDLGHQHITNCEFVAFMPNLKYLVLADTKVQDLTPLTGLTNLVFLEIFVTYLQDYTPLPTLTGLRDLNLSWTYGDPEIIASMPWLERVWWGGHWNGWQISLLMKEKCPNTKFVYHDPESTGSGWRTGKYYYEMRDMLGMFYMS